MHRCFSGIWALYAALIVALVWSPGTVRAENPEDQTLYREAVGAVQKKDWTKASAALDRWLTWRAKHNGAQSKESRQVGSLLVAIADEQQAQGQRGDATASLRKALEIFEVDPGPETAVTATCLNKLSLLLLQRNAFNEAEPLIQRALKIREKIYGKQLHPDLAASLGNLGLLYFQLGAYEEAEEPLGRALDIYALAARDAAYLLGALNVRRTLALVYGAQGRFGEGETMLKQVIDDTRTHFGSDSSEVAEAMVSLADLNMNGKQFKEAEVWFTKALEIQSRKLSASHETILRIRNSLAICVQYEGKYSEARQILEQIVLICQEKLGPDHPLTIAVTHNLGMNLITMGDKIRAGEYAGIFLNLLADHLEKVLAYFPENRRLTYVQNMGFSPYDLPATLGDGSLTAEAVLTFKAAVLESVARDRRRVLLAHDPNDLRLIELINELRQQFLEAELGGDTDRTKKLAAELDEKEKELPRHLRDEGMYKPLQQVAWENVASRLPMDAILLEFVFYNKHLGGDGGWRGWCGAVALARDHEPVFRELGPSDKILKSIDGYLTVVAGKSSQIADEIDSSTPPVFFPAKRSSSVGNVMKIGAPSGSMILLRNVASVHSQDLFNNETDAASLNSKTETACRDLFEELISPFAGLLPRNGAQLFICPDGQLNLVSFATLLDHNNEFVGSRFQVSYVDSGRVFLERSEPQKAASHLITLLGRPDFESSDGEATRSPIQIASRSVTEEELRLEVRRGISRSANISFDSLPKSGEEVEAIESVFRQKGWQTRLLTGAEATEANLRTFVTGANIVHLATHGYFNRAFNVGPQVRISNPMFCGWLALAGANATLRAWQKREVPPPANDGILMAAEVTGLDLSAAQLVVFSACDTGDGEARNGEGVLGLRRGVALAGAKNLLLTTWEIEDEYAFKFMKLLYGSMLAGDSPAAALQRIQASEFTKLREQTGTFSAVHHAGPFLIIFLKN